IESPSPVPCGPFVVKNGSKILPRMASEMPTPESATVTTTSLFSTAVVSVRVPPVGMASTAFKMRLVSASRSSAGSPATEGRTANEVCTSTATPRLRVSSRQRAVGARPLLEEPRVAQRQRGEMGDVGQQALIGVGEWPLGAAQGQHADDRVRRPHRDSEPVPRPREGRYRLDAASRALGEVVV